jgi:hypothetical protein
VSEASFQRTVIECAQRRRWKVAHFRPAPTGRTDARGRPTYRKPVAADGAGFPDLVLTRDGRVIFAELKRDDEYPSADQRAWLERLALVEAGAPERVLARVWRPRDWSAIEEALR